MGEIGALTLVIAGRYQFFVESRELRRVNEAIGRIVEHRQPFLLPGQELLAVPELGTEGSFEREKNLDCVPEIAKRKSGRLALIAIVLRYAQIVIEFGLHVTGQHRQRGFYTADVPVGTSEKHSAPRGRPVWRQELDLA